MSKKRFVDFYLAAMMKAATDGMVARLRYTHDAVSGVELIRVEYEHDHGGGVEEFPVTGESRLGITAAIVAHAREFLAAVGHGPV